MSNIDDLKRITKSPDEKRIGTVTKIQKGSVIVEDFLGRSFEALLESDTSIVVGDVVIVVNSVVIGVTEIESDPNTYEV